jgi:hypothetical protein
MVSYGIEIRKPGFCSEKQEKNRCFHTKTAVLGQAGRLRPAGVRSGDPGKGKSPEREWLQALAGSDGRDLIGFQFLGQIPIYIQIPWQ